MTHNTTIKSKRITYYDVDQRNPKVRRFNSLEIAKTNETPVEFIEEGRDQVYDKDKYCEMLLEAAETVLGYFGFDRTLFGNTSPSKNRKWWHQLRKQRQRDIDIEKSSNI